MLVYATEDDVFNLRPSFDPPDDVEWQLVKASMQVRHATRAATYDTLPSGLPKEDELREALRDATALQVAFWASSGVSPDRVEAGTTQEVASMGMGGRNVAFRDGSGRQVDAVTGLCNAAYLALLNVGLLNGRVFAV